MIKKNTSLKNVYKNLFEAFDSSSNPKILLLQGPAGSGKSYFANELIRSKPEISYVNVDDFVEKMIEDNQELSSRGINKSNAFSSRQHWRSQQILDDIREMSRQEGIKLQKDLQSQRKSYIVEGTGQKRYQEEIKVCQQQGYELLYLSVYAPLQFTIDSNKKRLDSGGRQLSDYLLQKIHGGYIDNYSRLKNWFMNCGVCTYFETTTMLDISKDENGIILSYPDTFDSKQIFENELSYNEIDIINNISKTKEQIKQELINKF